MPSSVPAEGDPALARWIRRELAADPPRVPSLIVTVWGDALVPHGGTAWLATLIALLAGFGVNERAVRTGEGNGPVNALDHALREALLPAYPELADLELIDYKVRILDAAHGTDAVTRVLIETADSKTSWTTIGVAANILQASWEALVESVTYGLLRAGVDPR